MIHIIVDYISLREFLKEHASGPSEHTVLESLYCKFVIENFKLYCMYLQPPSPKKKKKKNISIWG